MNKSEMVDAIYARGVAEPATKKQIRMSVEVLGDIIAETLAMGEEVILPSLGKLKVKEIPGRTGRNPRTGETLEIPPKRKVVFLPSKSFMEILN